VEHVGKLDLVHARMVQRPHRSGSLNPPDGSIGTEASKLRIATASIVPRSAGIGSNWMKACFNVART
jgi:hypothetical protein